MRIHVQLGLCLALLAQLVAGCRLLTSEEAVVQGRSPLRAARPSPDSVTVEIIWARFPAGDPALNADAWREIDETQLPPAVQCALASNGFRAGVIGTHLPEPIARALHQGELPSESDQSADDSQNVQLAVEPIVHGRVQRLQRDQRSEIRASQVYASLPLLVRGVRELSGRTYQQAQAVYALRADPQPDRTLHLELTPEIHHGAPRIRWTGGDDGILRQAPLREREVFDDLRMNIRLAPGEMLLLMSLPDAGSRLGHYFHTADSADGHQQKLVLIRLAEVPPSNTFAGASP